MAIKLPPKQDQSSNQNKPAITLPNKSGLKLPTKTQAVACKDINNEDKKEPAINTNSNLIPTASITASNSNDSINVVLPDIEVLGVDTTRQHQEADRSVSSNLVELPQAVASNFLELQAKLLADNPDIRLNLAIIHRELAKDPAIVTILTPEQIGVIFTGYSKQTGIEVIKAGGTGKGKKLDPKTVTSADFD